MKERDQAPLDQFAALLKQKWEDTKEWLHDNCVDEGKDQCNKRARTAENAEHKTSAIHRQGNRALVCTSGYEELDQISASPRSALPSAPPSAPPSQQNVPAAPPTASTLPLPGVAPQMSMRQMPPLSTPPPSAGMCPPQSRTETLKEIRPMWQRGEHVEVWSASRKCWFEGIVIESCTVDTISVVDGRNIPAGSYLVQYSEDTIKWIWPNQVHEVLRKPSGASGL